MSEVFLSWSKERSRMFAKALRELMNQVLSDSAFTQAPGSSPGAHLTTLSEDLPKGGSWFTSLAGLLEHAHAGVICVTPENVASPWLLFEAGALIRCDVEVALFPVLLDLPAQALQGPLGLVQATSITRDPAAIKRETHDLLGRIAEHLNGNRAKRQVTGFVSVQAPTVPREGAPVPDPWDAFVKAVLQIPPTPLVSVFDRFPQLFERKTFQEPFEDCADQRWLDRYAGARIARDEMQRNRARMETGLPPGAQLAYDRLSRAVDSYAMAIGGLLIEERAFGRDADGRLTDADGRLAVCERRRKDILDAYLRLGDPIPPVFDDARVYEELADLEERKVRLIHPLEQRLDAQRAEGKPDPAVAQLEQLDRAKTSPWLYDRIVFYAHAARAQTNPSVKDLLDGLERELTLLETRDEPGTLVGLYYALEAVEQRNEKHKVSDQRLGGILDRIADRIEAWNSPPEGAAQPDRVDRNRKVRRTVERLREHG